MEELTGDKTDSIFLEKEIGKESKFQGAVFEAIKYTIQGPDQCTYPREVVQHHGGCCIAAALPDGRFLMVRQYRFAVQQELLEFPAGKIEKGEDPAVCARRELEEEGGYLAASVKEMGYVYPTCGYSTEKIFLYYADQLKRTAQHLDVGEHVKVEYLTLSEILQLIEEGQIHDAKTIILAYKIKAMREKGCRCSE